MSGGLKMDDIYRGKLIRLGGEDSQTFAEAFNRWDRDTEYSRLLDDSPAHVRPVKTYKEWMEKEHMRQM